MLDAYSQLLLNHNGGFTAILLFAIAFASRILSGSLVSLPFLI